MLEKQLKEKGILAKLLEKGIEILLKRECTHISKINIDIAASSIQIIKGIIPKIQITAEAINYKDLLFDRIELEANKVKINLKLNNKELKFENDPKIRFKISLSESSIKKILLSNNWSWIGNYITKVILNQKHFKDIKIKNNQISIKASKDKRTINEEEKFEIKAANGKIYLENKNHNKSINIPIEDKVYIENVSIQNNLIIVLAISSLSF